MSEKTQWTPEQFDAITARRGTLLVSAAAGSGKTAVLVERVIQLLTDPVHPVMANRLLIVTFTKAATNEMRSRLSSALDERLREDPENRILQQQKMLLPSAKICTIDSFCGTLVRDHFDQLGISPDFRMLDPSESDIMQHQAVSTVVSSYYEDKEDDTYRSLVDLLLSGRDDAQIEESILKLYGYSRSYPSPSTWLHSSLREYDVKDVEDLKNSPLIRSLLQNVMEMLDYVEEKNNQILTAVESQEDLQGDPRLDLLKTDQIRIQDIRKAVLNYDFEQAVNLGNKQVNPYEKWSTKRKGISEASLDILNYARDVRNNIVKTALDERLPALLPATLEETLEDSKTLRPMAAKLVEAVEKLDQNYQALKQEENALDFSDVELLALRLLTDDPGAETPVFTGLAKEVCQQYDDILIDECQDTNRAQDLIFRAISRNEENLFMVGDVKQSIYRFRQASPELFLQRQEDYPLYDRKKDQYPAKVILGKNFRSRAGVLDYVNFTFEQLMSKSVGDLDYTDEQKLYYGRGDSFPAVSHPDAEVHLLQSGKEQNRLEQEADYTARFILEEIESSKDSPEPLRFRDFAILMSSPKNTAEIFKRVLSQYGIPVYADTSGGFLKTADVQQILSLLRVIDNPLQDVPLLSVMMSPLYGFTADEISEIRINHPKESIYSAVLHAEESGDSKCSRFLESIQRYRRHAVSMPAGQLLREIYEETAFPAVVQAMPNGIQREANLHLLLSNADQYDSFSTYGLSGFIRHLDRMVENDMDTSAAPTLSPTANVVQIMSVHKSKGLQFKICILANLEKQFNKMDESQSMVLHPALGIGLKGRNPQTGNTFPTLFHTAIREEIIRRSRSESLRVLYVAMTRAEEQLVLIGAFNYRRTSPKQLSALEKRELQLEDCKPVHPSVVKYSNSLVDWVVLSLLRHPNAQELRANGSESFGYSPLSASLPVQVKLVDTETDKEEQPSEENVTFQPTSHTQELITEIQERLSYQYPYELLSQTASKRTASKSNEQQEFSPLNFAKARPDFLSKGGLTPAERGTALHKYMQYADFETAKTNPEQELNRMVKSGLLSEEESRVVPLDKVSRFFQSQLYQRMKTSSHLMREKQFTISIPAGYFNPDLKGEAAKEPTLMQGVVDAAFVENGSIVVVDYKTDHVKNGAELAALYTDQLHVYAYAMQEITGMKVSELILYSFALDQQVDLPLEASSRLLSSLTGSSSK